MNLKHIKVIKAVNYNYIKDTENLNCSECQVSCQSACKTSSTVSTYICPLLEKNNVIAYSNIKINKQKINLSF